MQAPSRMLASATAVILLVAAMPARAASAAPLPPSTDPPIADILLGISAAGPDGPCPAARQSTDSQMLDWWRQWWSAATSRRAARQVEPERPARTPFYLRSPMMSGFFGWGDPEECEEQRPDTQRNEPPPRPPAVPPANTDSAALGPPPRTP